jgi:hypothetical protein
LIYVVKQGVAGYINDDLGDAIADYQALDHQQVKQSSRKVELGELAPTTFTPNTGPNSPAAHDVRPNIR